MQKNPTNPKQGTKHKKVHRRAIEKRTVCTHFCMFRVVYIHCSRGGPPISFQSVTNLPNRDIHSTAKEFVICVHGRLMLLLRECILAITIRAGLSAKTLRDLGILIHIAQKCYARKQKHQGEKWSKIKHVNEVVSSYHKNELF